MTSVLPFKAYFFEPLLFLMMASVSVFGFTHKMKINTLYVHSPVKVGDGTELWCDYDLGDETLYAVKFYKDEIEFYRYEPFDRPAVMTFHTRGVDIDESKSGNGTIYLRNLSLESSGNYTCEVSTTEPLFNTKRITKQLVVVGSTHKMRIISLHVPSPVEEGGSALLRCDYDLGEEPLYSFRFYKDAIEFYRYETHNYPEILSYPTPGVNVDESKSGNGFVYLHNLSLESSGNYTCEVTTDEPFYNIERLTKQLEVVKSIHEMKINMLHVPSPVEVGDSALLRCDYDLGDETLYSVKFYKDEIEFYRYEPLNPPEVMTFHTRGVDVDKSKSGNGTVYLRNLSQESSGNYTCEVFTDAPFYNIERLTKQLKVVDSRKHIPMKITTLYVPSPVVAGDSALLRCDYDLGVETLYSVKFYKDEMEFYRFGPTYYPMIETYYVPGVYVDVTKSGNGSVYLRNLTQESAGNYTCAVFADAPSFNIVKETKHLEIVVPPTDVPVLTKQKSDYELGDNVSIICNSGKSKPAPDIKWYVNNLLAKSHLYDKKTVHHPDKLESASLALSFKLKSNLIQNGKVTVKCVTTVKHVSAETSLEITASVSRSENSIK